MDDADRAALLQAPMYRGKQKEKCLICKESFDPKLLVNGVCDPCYYLSDLKDEPEDES